MSDLAAPAAAPASSPRTWRAMPPPEPAPPAPLASSLPHDPGAATSKAPDEATQLISIGCDLCEKGDLLAAEGHFLRVVGDFPDIPMGRNNLGWIYEKRMDFEAAIRNYRAALELNPAFLLARRNLAELLFDLGRFSESCPHWDALVSLAPDDSRTLNRAVEASLRAGDVQRASRYATRSAELIHGRARRAPPMKSQPAPRRTRGGLRHDIDQLRYLKSIGRFGSEFDRVIDCYERVLAGAGPSGPVPGVGLSEADRALIGESFGKILHARPTPALAEPALSRSWRACEAEDGYFEHPLGLVVVDEFLSPRALAELRAFCLESTVWFTDRYAHDRLGAFFRAGFNCPLLRQIADEISAAFPRLIGQKHPLLQMWGFKYGRSQPVTAPHADFAAVNVNIWITPDDANLDKAGGGLTIYDIEAPLDWSFEDYNRGGEKISEFLKLNCAKSITVPYRSNRALIFNSDLFHATSPFTFKEGYENRRINVTMLYGDRAKASRRDP